MPFSIWFLLTLDNSIILYRSKQCGPFIDSRRTLGLPRREAIAEEGGFKRDENVSPETPTVDRQPRFSTGRRRPLSYSTGQRRPS